MSKGNIIIVLALTFVWIILMESLSIVAIVTGVAVSIICVFFAKKYLPLEKIKGVNFNKLAAYPFFPAWSNFFIKYLRQQNNPFWCKN